MPHVNPKDGKTYADDDPIYSYEDIQKCVNFAVNEVKKPLSSSKKSFINLYPNPIFHVVRTLSAAVCGAYSVTDFIGKPNFILSVGLGLLTAGIFLAVDLSFYTLVQFMEKKQ